MCRLLLVAIAVSCVTVVLAAHPGHGVIAVVTGNVTTIEATRVQLDIFDRASFSRRKIWVVVDDRTTVRSGKAKLPVSDLAIGVEVECATETDEGPDGATFLRAITFRIKPARK